MKHIVCGLLLASVAGSALAQSPPLGSVPNSAINRPGGVLGLAPDGSVSSTAKVMTNVPAPALRVLGDKLSDEVSIKDFRAVCDGVTDDTNAVIAAGASGRRILVPDGLTCNAPGVYQSSMQGTFVGGGKVATTVNQGTPYQGVAPRGPQYAAVRMPPNPQSLTDNCSEGFSCWAKFDYSHTLSAEEYHISGAATLGQPQGAGTYATMAGAIAHNLFIDNSSGWNYSHNSNDGRTGGGAWNTVLQNSGAGDFGVFGAHVQCAGQTPPGDGNTAPGPDGTIINGYTDWLAAPECGFIGATLDALAPGQYLQLGEFPVSDHGNDVTAIGYVRGYHRQSSTAKINNRWIDELLTCNLTEAAGLPCDAVQVIGGKWALGHDFIGAAVPVPLAMSAGQKITFNGSTPPSPYAEGAPPSKAITGGDWVVDDGTGIIVAQSGNTVLRLSNPPNAVNSWAMSGGATGAAVVLAPSGADAAIPAILGDKGGAGVVLESNGQIGALITTSAAATSYLHVVGGTATTPVTLTGLGAGNQVFGLQGSGSGLVRLVGAVPPPGDSSNAAASTASVTAAVTSMTRNRYRILNVGGGAQITIPVPAGTLDQMIVEVVPNAATIPNLTLTMPASGAIPDGFIVHFVTTGTVSALTLTPAAGQAIDGAPASMTPQAPFALLWDAGLAQWLRF